MKRKKVFLIASLLTLSTVGVNAQVDESGKRVKRITFDCEQVTLEYDDGSKREDVRKAVITNDASGTGIKKVNTTEQSAAQARWYAIDGRQLPKGQNSPGNRKGVYVVKENDKVRKIIKK